MVDEGRCVQVPQHVIKSYSGTRNSREKEGADGSSVRGTGRGGWEEGSEESNREKAEEDWSAGEAEAAADPRRRTEASSS